MLFNRAHLLIPVHKLGQERRNSGKALRPASAEASGIGFAQGSAGDSRVAALVAVNAFGDVYEKQGRIIRGCNVNAEYVNTVNVLAQGREKHK